MLAVPESALGGVVDLVNTGVAILESQRRVGGKMGGGSGLTPA